MKDVLIIITIYCLVSGQDLNVEHQILQSTRSLSLVLGQYYV